MKLKRLFKLSIISIFVLLYFIIKQFNIVSLISTTDFNLSYLKHYLTYEKLHDGADNDETISVINKIYQNYDTLQTLGYTEESISELLYEYSIDELSFIIDNEIEANVLSNYMQNDNFILENINDYERIRKNYNDISTLEAINRYNHPYIDNYFYQHVNNAYYENDYLILVNKNYKLSFTYVPKELVFMHNLPKIFDDDRDRFYLNKTAYEQLTQLFNDAKKDGAFFTVSSGYRSYATQEWVYNAYVEANGIEMAELFSARPGHSEHQTGLAVDLTSEKINFKLSEEFANTLEGKWLAENCYKYGFIIRYPKNKANITGYIYEPWHIRYVGVEAATIIHNENLTLEEYLLKHTEMN